MEEIERILERIGRESRERFERVGAILSFSEYLDLLRRRPYALTRDVAQYTADMMDHRDRDDQGVVVPGAPVPAPHRPARRPRRLAGQEVQNELYRCLREFVQRRRMTG
ncbi:MAG: hypothetical protein R3F20_12240 [Planctomycetota bacterium]